MDQWAQEFLVRTQEAGLSLHMFAKYVDDMNVILSMVARGTRWDPDSGKLVHTMELEEEDYTAGRSQEAVTIECVRTIADSVKPRLTFTADLPENNASGMVPMLDVQVWIRHPDPSEDGLGSDLVTWKFYEKGSSSCRLLHSVSMYTWRSKITTLSMEIFRRLWNTTRQLTMVAKLEILTNMVDKMRRSNYPMSTVTAVLQSGITFYYRKTRVDLEGGPKVNTRREDNTLQRRREKLGGGENWFSRCKGGEAERERKTQGWRLSQEDGCPEQPQEPENHMDPVPEKEQAMW